MSRRYYKSTAVATTLNGGVSNSATVMTVAAVTGWPTNYPFTAIIDPDTSSEEVVEVTAGSGASWTAVTRGVDGTSAVSHSAGAAVRHGVSARDFDEPNAHIQASTSVHGITDTSLLVTTTGTQTLTNKTLTNPTINGVNTGTTPLATQAYADQAEVDAKAYSDSALSTHSADTTNQHGIADTAKLVTSPTSSVKVQTGTVTMSGAGEATVTFSPAFAATPVVVVSYYNSGGAPDRSLNVATGSTSASQFQVTGDAGYQVNWIAVGV